MENIIKGVAGEYVGNYTGPNWSDSKYQTSVEWGDADPLSELDYLSRQHDSAYARFKDRAHREAADRIYNEEAKKLAGKFPSIAGNLVLYGNHAGESLGRLTSGFSTGMKAGPVGALGGLVYGALGNMYALHKKLDGDYLKKELREVKQYYETDPRKEEMAKVGRLKRVPETRSIVPKQEPVSKPKEKTKNEILIENQARKFENYKKLKDEAEKSAQQQIKNLENASDWNMLGYQGRWKRRMRKHKKNRIYVSA